MSERACIVIELDLPADDPGALNDAFQSMGDPPVHATGTVFFAIREDAEAVFEVFQPTLRPDGGE